MARLVTRITSRTFWRNVFGVRRYGPEDKTAAYSLLASQSGGVFTNRGAAGAVQYTLPAGALKGNRFTFVVIATQQLQVHPAADTGTLEYNEAGGYGAQAAGKYGWADAAGEEITFISKGGDDWLGVGAIGTWTTEA